MVRLTHIERHPVKGPIAQFKPRQQDVTASVVPALFGLHPYVTPLKLYLMHSGIEFPDQSDNPVLRRGRLLEGAVGLAVAEQRPDWTVSKNEFYFHDPDLRLGATPDFFLEGDPRGLGVLQTKTVAPAIFDREWEGGRTVPFWIVLQTLTECLLTDAAFGVVAAMRVDAFDLYVAILDIPRHPAAEDKIIVAVKQFWDDVANGREPGPDYGRDANLLAVIAPRAVKDKTIDLSGENELPGLLDQRAQLKEQIKAYQKRVDEIDAEFKFKLRDAERAVGLSDWSISFKNQHRNQYTVPESDFRVLRITRIGER